MTEIVYQTSDLGKAFEASGWLGGRVEIGNGCYNVVRD